MSKAKSLKQAGGVLLVAWLAACASPPKPAPRADAVLSKDSTAIAAPRPGGYYQDDGPGDAPPQDLDRIPDAEPRLEPLHRFANNPYVVFGKTYFPDLSGRPYVAEGIASWYGRKFHGGRTSSGEPYDMYGMTAAHPTLPIPSYARVTNLANGKSVIVRINDRGPFHGERLIDLSYTAAWKLGLVKAGSGRVRVESIDATTWDKGRERLAQGTEKDSDIPAAFWIQLGAFGQQANAEQLAARVKAAVVGLGERLKLVSSEGWHRVRVGPFASREEATAALEVLRAAGLTPMLLR